MRKMNQRTQAVVRLDALTHNIKNIRSRLKPDCEIMAVLKGDGYGHGLAAIYPTLYANGIRRFAVAIWDEGAMLRAAGCKEPILILGDTCDADLPRLLEHDLTPTIFSVETAAKLNALAAKEGVCRNIHLKFDTGMSRIGLPANESSLDAVRQIAAMEHLHIKGAFTHFSRADEPDGEIATIQMNKYLQMLELLENNGIKVPYKHISNSPAILLRPEAQLDAVRAGDILFGLNPVDNDLWEKEDIQQVMHWYTVVALVKEVPAGTEVGYGGTYTTQRPTRIATIPVGFADGYSRRLSNLGKVRIHGQDAPIIGRVCMDQFMVDVTDIENVQRGDTVSLLDDDVSILWMADLIGANVDEIVCGVSKRVPRVYE